MPLPTPNRGESRDDFIGRCVESVSGEFEDNDQAVAVCFSQWAKRMDNEERVFERQLTIDRLQANEVKRTVPASLSSSEKIRDPHGYTILDHSAEAVDLSRAKDGLPLLRNHDRTQQIGVVENVFTDGEKLHGTLRLGAHPDNDWLWKDIESGILRNISISGPILDYEAIDDDTIKATRWALHEASIVSVPADSSIGINREVTEMESKTPDVVDFRTAYSKGSAEGEKAGQIKRDKESLEMRAIVRDFKSHANASMIEGLYDTALEKNWTLIDFQRELIKVIGSNPDNEPAGLPPQVQRDEVPAKKDAYGSVQAGPTSVDKFREGAEKALIIRGGLASQEMIREEDGSNEFLGYSMIELARHSLRMQGIAVPADPFKVAGLAFTRAVVGHSTSDFSNILESVSSKAMQMGYQEAPTTYQTWCRTSSLPDFKTATRPQLSEFPDLNTIPENATYEYETMSDFKESITLVTYGALFNISRQAIVNDDAGGFQRIARHQGAAAARKVNDVAYAILTGNPTLNQDSNSLFDATNHSNYVADGSGAAPSVTTINTARTSMATQTGPKGAVLNIRPAYLIVPEALRATANVLMASEFVPGSGNNDVNSVRGMMTVVADAVLDSSDTAAWFMAADPNQFDTVEVAFLQGNQAPTLETKEGWTVDGTEFKVRIDCAAAALDYRGLYQNDGN